MGGIYPAFRWRAIRRRPIPLRVVVLFRFTLILGPGQLPEESALEVIAAALSEGKSEPERVITVLEGTVTLWL